jgi:hypothetical protein
MIRYVQRISISTLVLLTLFLLVLGTHSLGFAQTGSWSEPVNISNTPNGSWFPDLAVDNMGNVHVVWCETEWDEFQAGTEYLFYTRRLDEGWTQPNDIVASSRWIHRNSIAVDTLGNLYLTFLEDNPPRYDRGIYFGHAPVDAAQSAASWSDWRFIGGRRIGYVSDIGVDRDNTLHVIYSESSESAPSELCPQGNCSNVFYRNSRDGGRSWSVPLNLSRSEPGTKRIGLMVDWQGRIHAFWDEGGDRYQLDIPIGVAYTVSHDGGSSWSSPMVITSTPGVPQQIIAGFDGKGQTVIAWRAVTMDPQERRNTEDLVYYQVSADGVSWSTPTPIPGILARTDNGGYAGYDTYDMATDSSGILHLVGAVQLSASDSTLGIYHLQWDGERWSAPERISAGAGYPENPRIVVEKGNVLHVVWAVKESSPLGAQRIEVWYSTKQLASPAWTPVPTPVPLATPTLTPVPSPVSTATPYPTPGGISGGLPTGLYTESDEVFRLAIALLPAVLVVVLVVLIKMGWFSKLRR